MAEKKYPKVKLIGTDGNAFAILGRCLAAARRAGMAPEEIAKFKAEAIGGSYDDLLATAMRYFEVT